jgi:hypothetical protein
VKLCIYCRHYGENEALKGAPVIRQRGESGLCMHPSTISEIDPVDGEARRYQRNALAYNQRQYPHFIAIIAGRCGTRARFFEERGCE